MNHLNEETIRAYMENELKSEEQIAAERHLRNCAECSDQLAAMQSRSGRVASYLDVLRPADPRPTASHLLARVIDKQSQPSFSKRMAEFRPAWVTALTAAILIFAFSFEPVKLWATQFLNLFRVQKINVLQIDPANLQRLERDFFGDRMQPKIEQLFSEKMRVTEHGKPREVSGAEEAAKAAGFGVRLPRISGVQPKLRIQPAADISFLLDVDHLQGILDDAGRSDIRLPEEIDGQFMNFQIAASVTAFYGDCPSGETTEGEPRKYENCKIFGQMPSPTVAAPYSLDVQKLGQAFLQLLGMTKDQAEKFSENVDWTSTLIVPMPLDPRTQFREVDVDGVTGTLITREFRRDSLPSFSLIWVRDGILYSLMARGSAEDALTIANSLH